MGEAMSNRSVIERYHHAIAIGDYDTVLALHAPDVGCWMSGRSIVSGRFQGREALFEHMGRNVLGPLVVGTEDYVKGARIVVEDPPFVVAVFHGGLPNRTGGRYDQYYLQLFRLEHGLIHEIVELFDTVMYEEAVAGNRLATSRPVPDAPFTIGWPLAVMPDRAAMVVLAESFAVQLIGGMFEEAAGDVELGLIGTTPLSGVGTADAARLRRIFAGGIGWYRLVAADAGAAVLLMRAADPDYAQQYGVLIEADGARIGRVSVFADTVALEQRLFDNALLPGATASIMPPFDLRVAFSSG